MEFKHDINMKLENKNVREEDESETLYEGIVLLKKENNCLKMKVNTNSL